MIRKFDKLPREKQTELEKIAYDLNALRPRLDGVMYGGNPIDIPSETLEDLRTVYSYICKALDNF